MEQLDNLPINIFDAGVIVILLVSGLLAYARGFVHEVLSIAGWIGAIFATFYGFPYLRPYARQFIELELAADLAAGVIIFLVALVLLSTFTRGISKKVQDSALNALDRALGFLFGLLRGALIVVVAYIGLELVLPKDKQPKWIREARSMELIEPGARYLLAHLPEDYSPAKKDEQAPGSDGTGSALDPSKVVRDLITPSPKVDGAEKPEGYGTRERQEMERLIGNTNQQ